MMLGISAGLHYQKTPELHIKRSAKKKMNEKKGEKKNDEWGSAVSTRSRTKIARKTVFFFMTVRGLLAISADALHSCGFCLRVVLDFKYLIFFF